ncbi:MAG: GNAT family N-acetyltransferase [Gammaproteobacteria bacterium]|nr:GNAT family N-acetyltransferase [Gammaproteobacteria bacterium]MCP5137968.1 GNAT family N-acetyltransferase [Gammaproteobacteria bacterium]
MADAPVFRLRGLMGSDIIHFHAHLEAIEVRCWLDDWYQQPRSLLELETVMFTGWACVWAIEVDGRFVGVSGFSELDKGRGVGRFFIVIGETELWGKRLGGLVAADVIRRGFDELGLRKVVSDYLAPNVASEQLHRRLGFVEEGVLRADSWRRGEYVDRVLLARFA